MVEFVKSCAGRLFGGGLDTLPPNKSRLEEIKTVTRSGNYGQGFQILQASFWQDIVCKIAPKILHSHAKTGSYFVMHLVVAILVAFAITGSWAMALGIGIAEPLVQTFCYHFHEKIWAKRQIA